MGDSGAFLLRACVFLLLLIVSLVQLWFFALLPDVSLHEQRCNATLAVGGGALPASDARLAPPMRMFYQSLYLSPREISRREKEQERRKNEQDAAVVLDAAAKQQHALDQLAAELDQFRALGDQLNSLQTVKKDRPDQLSAELDLLEALPEGFFLQTLGQGHEPIGSRASYCINLIMATNDAASSSSSSSSISARHDLELYLNALPSSRPVLVDKSVKEPMELPTSVVDIYLARHPSSAAHFGGRVRAPAGKAVWLLQDPEQFDRHELSAPPLGVLIVKTRVALKKLLEYRHRHRLAFSVLYAKHTSADVLDPDALATRDWTSFLHLAGAKAEHKNTKVIVKAWAKHPEWPNLVLRVMDRDLCRWIERQYGSPDQDAHGIGRNAHKTSARVWSLRNVDYACGALPSADKTALQNRIGLHLVPSETEGFSHSLNEARSVGAVVLTADAAPMNELVDARSGVLVGSRSNWWWQSRGDLFVPVAHVDEQAIADGVERLLLLPVEERARMGRRARARFLEDRAYFMNAMAAIEQSLCQDEVRVDRLQPFLY